MALNALAADPAKASFEKDILPLIEDHCFACHGDGQEKGGIKLDSFKAAGDVHRRYKLRRLESSSKIPSA